MGKRRKWQGVKQHPKPLPKASVFVRRAKMLHEQERKIRDCREVQYYIFTVKEQEVLAGWAQRISRRQVLTPKQADWLENLYARACAYDERGGRDR